MIRSAMAITGVALVILAVAFGRPAPAVSPPSRGIEDLGWAPLPPPPPPPPDPGGIGHVMMTLLEARLVEAALAQRMPPRPSVLPPVDRLPEPLAATAPVTLSGVQFVDSQTWAVWLNGLAVTPGMDTGLVKVVAVAGQRVTLSVARGAAGLVEVVLTPNQTYMPLTGEITTGLPR